MPVNNKFRQFRNIEAGINKHLFLICAAVTVIAMSMITLGFFTRGGFPPTRMSLFYLGVLIIYSFHKELVRWLGRRKIERQGEYFVYGWIGLTTLLYTINFLTKDYFNYSAQGESLTTLRDVSVLTLQVLGVFISTRALKILKVLLIKPKS